jgi:hypothetical protein
MIYIFKLTTLKGPFFSRLDKLDKTDLRLSEVFAVLTLALSIFTSYYFETCSSIKPGPSSFSYNILFLILFPLNLLEFSRDLLSGLSMIFPGGSLLVVIPFYILSFIFKVICFYSLARFNRKILGQNNMFLLNHLPSLFISIIFYSFLVPSILQCY